MNKATSWTTDESWFDCQQGHKQFLVTEHADRLWVPNRAKQFLVTEHADRLWVPNRAQLSSFRRKVAGRLR